MSDTARREPLPIDEPLWGAFRGASRAVVIELNAGRSSSYESDDGLPSYNVDELPPYNGGYLEHGDRLDQLGKRADVVEFTLKQAWDITVPLGRNFDCLLPGHDRHASMYCDPQSGVWKLHCWCRDEWWSLAEARASRAYRHPRRLKNAESAVWYRRLWYDASLIAPRPVPLPPLLHRPTPAILRVLDGFSLLVGLRWLTHVGQPVPYTRDFAAAWSAVSKGTAQKAIAAALDSGSIRHVDNRQIGQHVARLFLPGNCRTTAGGRA